MRMRMTMTVTMNSGDELGQLHFLCFHRKHFLRTKCVCHRLYFLFSYKRSAALGQFVIHRGLIISVMQVGMLYVLTSRTLCAK